MNYLLAFLAGGAICALGQLIKNIFRLTTAHIVLLFVTFGVFLDCFEIYDRFIELAGAGALLPITSFGHLLSEAAFEGYNSSGILGMLTEIYSKSSGCIALVILLAFFIGIFFKPKK